MRRIALTIVLLAGAVTAAAQSPADRVVERGQAAFKNNGCYGCHMIGKFGTPIGPDLSHVGRKYQEPYLARWLRDPAMQRPNAHMPALELSEDDVRALARYLSTLR
jgi:mono/diheme cytochrome c family protein